MCVSPEAAPADRDLKVERDHAEPHESWHRQAREAYVATNIGTLNYRAFEICMGDPSFDAKADAFSLGMVLADVVGFNFAFSGAKNTVLTQIDYITALFRQLGTPPAQPEWKYFPADPPSFRRSAWPFETKRVFGAKGLELLDQLLELQPLRRCSAEEALCHDFFRPCALALGGSALRLGASVSPLQSQRCSKDFELFPSRERECFQGARHPWNALVGHVAPEVLEWLLADPSLARMAQDFDLIMEGGDADVLARRGIRLEERRNIVWARDARSNGDSTIRNPGALPAGACFPRSISIGQCCQFRRYGGDGEECGARLEKGHR